MEEAIKKAKTPGPVRCPECNENMFSSMDKLSICLHNRCTLHLEEYGRFGGDLVKELFEIIEKEF